MPVDRPGLVSALDAALMNNGHRFTAYLSARLAELWRQNDESPCASFERCEGLLRLDVTASTWRCCDQWQRVLSNKLNAKAFATMHGVAVAALFWHDETISPENVLRLPQSYAIKLTNGHSSQQVLLVRKGEEYWSGQPLSPDDVVARVVAMRGYKASGVRVMAEELLLDRHGGILADCKFYCFDGRAEVFYITDRNRREWVWYDREWRPFSRPFNIAWPQGKPQPRPDNFEEMLDTVDHLARQYDGEFVRLDFYADETKFWFGEFTHTPLCGQSLTKHSAEAEVILGELWNRARRCRENRKVERATHVGNHNLLQSGPL